MPLPTRSLILLDRDGVINRDSDQYIRTVAEWVPLPGSLEAIAKLTGAGFPISVVTNQSGVGRGYFSEQTLSDIHAEMRHRIESAGGKISGVYYCPHRPDEHCECRKPKPQLLLQAIADHKVAAVDACYVGDKLTDAEAAQAAGVRPILVGTIADADVPAGVAHFRDLAAAADALIAGIGAQ